MSDALPVALRDQEQMMPGFARWMYRTVRGDLGETVLDAGAGIGTFTEILVADHRRVAVLETEPAFLDSIRTRFDSNSAVTVHRGDLTDENSLAGIGAVDSVLCLNVLEHIDDDQAAMRNLLKQTKPGGNMVALVPAYPWLLNKMDRAIGHHRRYGRGEFVQRLESSGWKVERVFRFNAFGLPGWFVAGNLLRRSTPGRGLYRLFDSLVPVFALLERMLIRGSIGLSLIAVCRRVD
ncbi:MAG TPA: class I SAM-dependent methyltransferase [Gemmatimonadales bacterium]|nr:class I SAM-dependent methyltransferase [Gemmatimonadales bacterium]